MRVGCTRTAAQVTDPQRLGARLGCACARPG
jgi:hypothetical protein